jgi:hypothetical protein
MFRPVLEVRVDIPNWQSLTLLVVHFRALINMHPKMSQGRWTSSQKSGIFWVNYGSWGRLP